jgi:type II secretory ATPase GspE/PulE/Tfp pilus assembly ATPase PilB-like protein
MLCTDELRSLILERAPSHELRKIAVKDGMRNLREDGWRLVGEGRTTIEEVFRNTKDDAMHLDNLKSIPSAAK